MFYVELLLVKLWQKQGPFFFDDDAAAAAADADADDDDDDDDDVVDVNVRN